MGKCLSPIETPLEFGLQLYFGGIPTGSPWECKGTSTVLPWESHGEPTMLPWESHGCSAERLWRFRGSPGAPPWYLCGTAMGLLASYESPSRLQSDFHGAPMGRPSSHKSHMGFTCDFIGTSMRLLCDFNRAPMQRQWDFHSDLIGDPRYIHDGSRGGPIGLTSVSFLGITWSV